jgi:hypothetical protein
VTCIEWERVPFTPVTVIVPVLFALTVRTVLLLELAFSLTVDLLRVADIPYGVAAVTLTLPTNPTMLVRVMLKFLVTGPDALAFATKVLGVALMVKSAVRTVIGSRIELVRVPLIAVIVTV